MEHSDRSIHHYDILNIGLFHVGTYTICYRISNYKILVQLCL